MTNDQALTIVGFLAAAFGVQIEAERAAIYAAELASFEYDDAIVAVRKLARTVDRFPPLFWLLRAVSEARSSRHADEAVRSLPEPAAPADVPPEVQARFAQLREKLDAAMAARRRAIEFPAINVRREGGDRPPPTFLMRPGDFGPTTGPRLADGHAYVPHRGGEAEIDWWMHGHQRVFSAATWTRMSPAERRAEGLPRSLTKQDRAAGFVAAGVRPDPDDLVVVPFGRRRR